MTVGSAIDGMIHEVWSNNSYDNLSSNEAVSEVVNHLKDIYNLEAGKDYDLNDIKVGVNKYD